MQDKKKTQNSSQGKSARKDKNKEIEKWTREFIEKYRTDLEALAKN